MAEMLFYKSHGPDLAQELLRLSCLEAVCAETGQAVTAQVRGVDAEKRRIAYQRLERLQRLSLQAGQSVQCFRDLGVLIAGLHQARPAMLSAVQRDLDWERSQLQRAGIGVRDAEQLLEAFPAGFAHGDLWHGNILLQDGQWVVLDPIPSGEILKGVGLHASGVFDLASLHMSLFVRRPLREFFSKTGSIASAYGEALLSGYLESADAKWARASVLQLSRSLAQQWCMAYRQRLSLPVALAKGLMFDREFNGFYASEQDAP